MKNENVAILKKIGDILDKKVDAIKRMDKNQIMFFMFFVFLLIFFLYFAYRFISVGMEEKIVTIMGMVVGRILYKYLVK